MNQELRIKKTKDKIGYLSHYSLFIIRKSRGFTLIELMVVLSVTAILGMLGIAGFIIYNQIQVLQSATNDLVTTLNVAKSRALSQVKPSACTPTLQGYRVDISISGKNYILSSICSDQSPSQNTVYTKSLPNGVIFKNTPDTKPTTFTFPILVGGVQNTGQITLSAYGRDKIITINPLGGVSVQ